MLTNKDIRVENGNLVLNGDKFPLDGQSPEAIMQIVKDNSDTTPTASSDNPVKSGGIKTYVDNAVAKTSITPTLNSGFVMDNGSITISNKVCYFAPNFYYNTDFTVGTAVNVGTLPPNCKPKTGIRIASLSGTAELLGVIMIDTGGAITYYPANISKYFGYVQACFEIK